MSLIEENSEECSTSPLEWFDVPPTQTAVEKSYFSEYQPLTSLHDGSTIDFYIPASTDDYVDLQSTRLYLKCQLALRNGTLVPDEQHPAPVNDLFNSLWSNVELILNDRLVSHSNGMHGYISMISHLIHDSEESLQSERSMRLIFKDTPNQMDATEPRQSNYQNLIPGYDIRRNAEDDGFEVIPPATAVGNHGLYQRNLLTSRSRFFELMGPLRIDLFEQERYLPNGISIKLRFHRQKPRFALMSEGTGFKVKILEAYLYVRKVRPSPGVLLGHTEALSKMPAKFPITRKECKEIAIASGLRSVKKDNIFLGQLPKRVVVAMVDGDAAAGSYAKNPYNFRHYNVNFMQLFADGEPVRAQPLKPNMSTADYIHCYETLYRGLNNLDGEKGCIIKRVDWNKGYSLFAFDLTPDMDADDHYALIRHGNLRLEVEFADALPHPINILVYAEFDNVLEITSDRHIQFDYV